MAAAEVNTPSAGTVPAVEPVAQSRSRGPRRSVSVILPLHNEEGTLEELHKRLHAVFAALPYDAEFIFVNDGSTDRSLFVLEQLAAADPRVKFVSLSRNFGHQ